MDPSENLFAIPVQMQPGETYTFEFAYEGRIGDQNDPHLDRVGVYLAKDPTNEADTTKWQFVTNLEPNKAR